MTRLKREISWDEAVAEYKNYLKDMLKNPDLVPKQMAKFREYYKILSQK